MSLAKAIADIEENHGGCDSNTCTISVALRNGYNLVAVDSWAGSGAASDKFPSTLPFSFKDVQKESKRMCAELAHVKCPNCDAVLWLPEEAGYWCDNCANPIPR